MRRAAPRRPAQSPARASSTEARAGASSRGVTMASTTPGTARRVIRAATAALRRRTRRRRIQRRRRVGLPADCCAVNRTPGCEWPRRCQRFLDSPAQNSPFTGISDGHGWARTSDLSRVKRLASAVRRHRFAGSLAITPVSRWVVYSFGLLGFIAVLVHRISLWTSGGALVMSVTLSSGLDRSEGVSARG